MRIPSIVMSFPRGTLCMMAATCAGAGITTVPSPQRLDILPLMGQTFGTSLYRPTFRATTSSLYLSLIRQRLGFEYDNGQYDTG
jgi:hypothetical protein